MTEGILYVTAGEVYLDEAALSARTVKDAMPDVPVAIVADRAPDADVFDEYLELPEPHYGWMDKVENLPRSPFEKTIYFDSDVYVEADVSELFALLDGFDVALAPDPFQHPVFDSHPYHDQGGDLYAEEVRALTEYQAGVIAYRRSDAVDEMLADWRELYEPADHWSDQPSLRVAIARNDVRIHPLRAQYNYVPGLETVLSGEVKIVHNRLLDSPALSDRWKDVEPSALDALIEKVNRDADAVRVTLPAFPGLDETRVRTCERARDVVVRPPASSLDYLYAGLKTGRPAAALRRCPPVASFEKLYHHASAHGVRTTLAAAMRRAREALASPTKTPDR